MKIRYIIITALLLMAHAGLSAQVNGSLQQIGEKRVLQVWGSHYERGLAQGYFLGEDVMEVFNDFYYTMYTMSSPTVYNAMWNYYQEHFDQDPRVLSEAGGLIAGMGASGTSIYHSGLQRELDADDIMLLNAFWDMQLVRGGAEPLEFGCASLSSWGTSTLADSLLTGSAVVTRLLDWTQNTALIGNPVLVVHHPAETDEQKWLNFTYPGLLGAISAISEHGTSAFPQTGNEHTAANTYGLDPLLLGVRRGLERYDYNGDGSNNSMDVYAAVGAGSQLTGSIIHCLSDDGYNPVPVVIETNNGGTVVRYVGDNGNLAGDNLAATNHFRVLINPTCCDRYAAIQDSLAVSHQMSAKRQWRLLAGAAGLETNLHAIQYVPTTGNLLWASAETGLPAYQAPAITLNANDLFNFDPVATDDVFAPAVAVDFSFYPNPLPREGGFTIKSGFAFDRLRLYNLRGQLVHSLVLPSKQNEYGTVLPDLPTGIYLLQIISDKGYTAGKRIVIGQ